MVKDDVCVIDVGITRIVDKNNPKGYVIKGDVDFKEVSKKACFRILSQEILITWFKKLTLEIKLFLLIHNESRIVFRK